uniref:Tpd52 like 2a n=1 Tax=Echeneis naucrates TaxID=173247 RepID=A0A665TIS9_ECHNA
FSTADISSSSGFGGAPSSINFSTRIADTSNYGCPPSELTDEDIESLQFELSKTEDEIQTLRQVLLAKEKYAADIRRQLGMSPLSNIKQNLSKGWQEVQTSAPYVRTRESLSHAGQVTSSALSSVGVVITRRLAEMRNELEMVVFVLSDAPLVPLCISRLVRRKNQAVFGKFKEADGQAGGQQSHDTAGNMSE